MRNRTWIFVVGALLAPVIIPLLALKYLLGR